jgi:two-component system, response regulator
MTAINKKLSVLIVNDDPGERFMFTSALEEISRFIDINFIYSSRQLLDFLLRNDLERELNRQSFPDLVLADVNAGNSGLEAVAEVRNHKQLDKLPIYLFSSGDIESMEKRAMDKGANGLYKIPCNIYDLKAVLSYILRKERS